MEPSEQSRGVPYQSKLRPYVGEIRKWRRSGYTWAEIAEKLDTQGCKTRATNLCQFMRRYRKRPFPSGAEPEIVHLAPARVKPARKERSVSAKDSSTPYFEQLVDEAQETARQTKERPVFNVIKPTRPL
ncbi:MAG TPA: hypothetical protein VE641_01970 [Chthoniobacterales bacterium]|nr:hypothetical protein [Chthoniobacterales bacterium]